MIINFTYQENTMKSRKLLKNFCIFKQKKIKKNVCFINIKVFVSYVSSVNTKKDCFIIYIEKDFN